MSLSSWYSNMFRKTETRNRSNSTGDSWSRLRQFLNLNTDNENEKIIGPMGQFLDKPKTEKHNSSGQNDDLRYGLGSMQGWRVEMEDAHSTVLQLDDNRWSKWSFFGIFDGHAGYRTAIRSADRLHLRILSCLNDLIQENSNLKTSSSPILSSQLDFNQFEMTIKDAYFKFDNEWREELRTNMSEDKSGSTAISCLIDSDRVYFLNVGDSRGILVSIDGRILLATKDHKPNDQAERQRIQEAGGTVLIQRVNGSLAVSRALGDFEYKNNANRRPDQQLVSPEPEISVFSQDSTTNEQIAFVVLACDGIWDVMSNEELATYILGRMNVTDDLCEIANSVLDMCLYKGSKDNMSLAIIAFKNAPVPNPELKAKDEALNNEIRKKTIEIYNRNPNKTSLDANTVWQQVVTSLNELSSIREALPVSGGFISKRSVFESAYDSVTKGTSTTPNNTTTGLLLNDNDDQSSSSTSTISSLTQ